MAWDVHIHVCFSCDRNEPVAELARRHLEAVKARDGDDGDRAAVWFLEDLAKRTGGNPGPKGGLSLWGMVGNYTNGASFCEALKPFFEEMLIHGVGGICQHEHILVFEEQEQSESPTVYEIMLDGDYDSDARRLAIKRHENLPFTWMQM
jgi:hypothetical protein